MTPFAQLIFIVHHQYQNMSDTKSVKRGGCPRASVCWISGNLEERPPVRRVASLVEEQGEITRFGENV